MENTAIDEYENNIIETASMALSSLQYLPQDEGEAKSEFEQNFLLEAAETILLQLDKLRSLEQDEISLQDLQKHLISDVQRFEYRLKIHGVPAFMALVLRYTVCAIVDEAILMSVWGIQNEWSRHSLLNVFHQDTRGGENFFILLDKMRQVPQRNLDVLEFMYVCLCLGFMGKYKLMENGHQQLETLRQKLFTQIRANRLYTVKALMQSYEPPKSRHFFRLQWKMPTLIAIGVIALLFVPLKMALDSYSKPVIDTMHSLSQQFIAN